MKIENGYYSLCIRQLFNPENYDFDNPPNPFYELVVSKIDYLELNNIDGVIWWEYDN